MKTRILQLCLISILMLYGCEEENSLTDYDSFQGSWKSTFTVIYEPEMIFPEGGNSPDTVNYTARIEFKENDFTLNVNPPVRPYSFRWWGGSRSQWFGEFSLEKDTIFFDVADSSVVHTPYIYVLNLDSLFLSRAYVRAEDDSVLSVTLGGGLPWGFAGMKQNGWFQKQ